MPSSSTTVWSPARFSATAWATAEVWDSPGKLSHAFRHEPAYAD